MPRGGSKKGERRGGRKKGTPNRLTRSVKEAIFESFKTLGGAKYLVQLARKDPRSYSQLLGRIIPTEVAGEINLTHERALEELEAAARGGET